MGSPGSPLTQPPPPRTMPHICGPHSNLPNCRYHTNTKAADPGTTWVPIPIHKVQELPSSTWDNPNQYQRPSSGGQYPSNGSQYPSNGDYYPTNGGQQQTNRGTTDIPIKLDAPSLILRAKEKSATDDELFPRKRKSEFTK